MIAASGCTIGLVGCGSWGKNVLRDLVTLGCRVLVADPDPAARERAAAGGAAGVRPDAEELPDCDGYVVVVPIPLLAPLSAQLLARGRPVFAEKTLCLTLESADVLARLGGDERLFVMHKWRYHPGIDRLRQLCSSGALGEATELYLTRHTWVPDFHGGDVFFTQAVHDLTIARHVLGRIPPVVNAWAGLEGARPVTLLAVLQDRCRVLVSTSARHPAAHTSVTLRGTGGSASLADPYAPQLVVRTAAGVREVRVDTTFPLLLELREFVDHLRGGPAPRCTLAEARELTGALLDLRRAAGLRA